MVNSTVCSRGSDSAITGHTLSRVPLLHLIAVGDDVDPEFLGEDGVIRAELTMGRDRTAPVTVAELGGARRSSHASIVTRRFASETAQYGP